MDDTKHHVIDSVSASDLPDRLRGDIDPAEIVTVTVTVKNTPEPTFEEIFESLHESRVFSDDPVLRVRALREEWEERDRFHDQIGAAATGIRRAPLPR
jgi:hypothetical protein